MGRFKEFEFPKEEKKFPLVDKGTYRCYIFDVEDDISEQGNPVLIFQHKIAEGDFKGQILFDRYSLLPQAMWRLQQMLLTFGINARGKVAVDLDELVGAECNVTVIHQNYEGEARPRVRKVVGLDTISTKKVQKVKTKDETKKVAKVKTKSKTKKVEEGKETTLKDEEMPKW